MCMVMLMILRLLLMMGDAAAAAPSANMWWDMQSLVHNYLYCFLSKDGDYGYQSFMICSTKGKTNKKQWQYLVLTTTALLINLLLVLLSTASIIIQCFLSMAIVPFLLNAIKVCIGNRETIVKIEVIQAFKQKVTCQNYRGPRLQKANEPPSPLSENNQ